MKHLTEQIVASYSPNASADSNARALAAKHAFPKLFISDDESLIFGECEGSAKDNYRCSVDFLELEVPVFRCTCPSRQIPCKHVLGLMYSYVQKKQFSIASVPPEISEKREARLKKKEKEADQAEIEPKQVNKGALKKKIITQLEGLEILKKLLDEIISGGLGTISSKTYALVDAQIKNLGNYYLGGVQDRLREFNLIFRNNQKHETAYSTGLQHLNSMYSLYKKGKEYLQKKLDDPELRMDVESDIEELLGHAWQLDELELYGRVINKPELIQLSFYSYPDNAILAFVDEGIWFNLTDGKIYRSLNYRPYRAAKHIREDDSYYEVVKTEKLYLYPGDHNNRIRWETASSRKAQESDFSKIKSSCIASFSEAVKQAKNVIKNPLSNKSPLILIKYSEIGLIDGNYVAIDGANTQIALEDSEHSANSQIEIFKYLDSELLNNQAMLVRFFYDIDAIFLSARPHSIITDKKIIRLLF